MSTWQQMEWEEIKTAFDWDGSWRDLYVFETTTDDWQRLVDLVRKSVHPHTFQRGPEVCALPAHVNVLFEKDAGALLSMHLGGITLNAHFFCDEQIELDLDPREVHSDQRARALFEFMRGLGQVLGKPVRLTPENLSDYVLFEYDPVTDNLRRGRP